MSKAFVIKNKEGKYLAISSNGYEHYWTDDIFHSYRFIPLSESHDIEAETEEYRDIHYPDCEVVPITIVEGDLEQENKQLKEQHDLLIDGFQKERENLCKQIKQESDARERFVEKVKQLKEELAEKDKEIEKLNLMIKTLPNHDTEMEQLIRKNVCDKIREKLQMDKDNTCGNTAFCVYYDYLKEVLNQIEKDN